MGCDSTVHLHAIIEHPEKIQICQILRDISGREFAYDTESIEFKLNNQDCYGSIMNGEEFPEHALFGPKGSLVINYFQKFDLIDWDKLVEKKEELETWCQELVNKYDCTFTIVVAAKYS